MEFCLLRNLGSCQCTIRCISINTKRTSSSYNPGLAPRDFTLSSKHKGYSGGKQFTNDEYLKQKVPSVARIFSADEEYKIGTEKLIPLYEMGLRLR
ncbi:hypothetical protein TNIN_281091 [Trichonephila inaurata madagascariensis]|uniref:Uncharacterized protein n=1 Tax=Trichonephila inaurata madagascariensis TaxID=2747483 RepID=A0A8X7C313_9ARAC|nr:hypothetical protein TNIN_281091 [Trichonephila inaurata madagascariensis]